LSDSIDEIKASTIYASNSDPTIEVRVVTESGASGTASVPSGISIGKYEAVELRDGGETWHGRGVEKALANIRGEIFPRIASMLVTDQGAVDRALIETDGTPDKRRLGANATLAVSLAVARAGAASLNMPLYEFLGRLYGGKKPHLLPIPMVNLIDGGKRTGGVLPFQSLMVIPLKAAGYWEAIRGCSEINKTTRDALKGKDFVFGVGPEGGIVPQFPPALEATRTQDKIFTMLDICLEGMQRAGYQPGIDFALALEPTAQEFYTGKAYRLGAENLTVEALVQFYGELVDRYPLLLIEDGMAETDEKGWRLMCQALGGRTHIAADGLLSSHIKRFSLLKKINVSAVVISPGHLGTLTETLEAIREAGRRKLEVILSHRPSETEDTFISHLSVACSVRLFKAGGTVRSDRTAKYNELLRIGEALGGSTRFAGKTDVARIFPKKR